MSSPAIKTIENTVQVKETLADFTLPPFTDAAAVQLAHDLSLQRESIESEVEEMRNAGRPGPDTFKIAFTI